MREFSRTQSLLELALRNAGGKRIVRVHLLIGPFSEERQESIRFYWRDLANGSPAEGAELQFEHLPVQTKCLDCSGTLYMDGGSMCKYCCCEHVNVLNGEDVKLERIEVE